MTTDTYAKLATRTAEIGGVPVVINGFCKGAGMMAPDMATMLCFIFTDAAISQPVLQGLLAGHAETTFNCMTVDGDTSTSDTCLLFATGAAAKRGQQPVSEATDPRLAAFSAALHDLLRDLAIQVAKDGEGMRKFVTIEIGGAESWAAARTIARACANSPIVKAAIFGEDPNWGRVVMAIGKAGEAADRDKLSIWFGPHIVARDGERAAEYVEETVAAYMKGREIVIRADVGVGSGQRHGVDLRPHPRLHLDQRGLSQLRQAISASLTSMAVNKPSWRGVNPAALAWGQAWAWTFCLSRPAR